MTQSLPCNRQKADCHEKDLRTDSIQDMVSYLNSRLKLMLHSSDDKEIIVARERVQAFKDWLDR